MLVSVVLTLFATRVTMCFSRMTLEDMAPTRTERFSIPSRKSSEPSPHSISKRAFNELQRINFVEPISHTQLILVNAVARPGTVAVGLRGVMNKLKFGLLKFGDKRKQSDVQTTVKDKIFAVSKSSHGREKTVRNMSEVARVLPQRADLFVIASVAMGNTLALWISTFDTTHYTKATEGSLSIFNALHRRANENADYDVIIFNPILCPGNRNGNSYCLHRVARALSPHNMVSILFTVPGVYELKVVKPEHITTVDHFKNTPSLLGPERFFFEFRKGQRIYAVLAGIPRSQEFPPTLIGIDRLNTVPPEFEFPTTPFLIFNAYPDLSGMEVTLPISSERKRTSVSIPYGQAVAINQVATEGDIYHIIIDGANPQKATIRMNTDIPYDEGHCLLVADAMAGFHGSDDLDAFLSCWSEPELLRARKQRNMIGHIAIASYHALARFPANIDIFFKSPVKHIFKVADSLRIGEAQMAGLLPGYYEIMAVHEDGLTKLSEYDRAVSLLPSRTCVYVAMNETYYAIFHGVLQSDENSPLAPRVTLLNTRGEDATVPRENCTQKITPPTQPSRTNVVDATTRLETSKGNCNTGPASWAVAAASVCVLLVSISDVSSQLLW